MGARVSAIVRGGNGCVSLAGQTRAPDEVVSIAHGGLEDGLRKTTGELVLLLDEQDELDADCLETLLRALSSGVDVVTCGVRNRGDEVRLFVGEARELGLIGNYYGLVGLYRRSVLENGVLPPEVDGDVDWLLLASASLAGARVASVPRPLVSSTRIPGSIADGSGEVSGVLCANRWRRHLFFLRRVSRWDVHALRIFECAHDTAQRLPKILKTTRKPWRVERTTRRTCTSGCPEGGPCSPARLSAAEGLPGAPRGRAAHDRTARVAVERRDVTRILLSARALGSRR